jgi:hypothetical protein
MIICVITFWVHKTNSSVHTLMLWFYGYVCIYLYVGTLVSLNSFVYSSRMWNMLGNFGFHSLNDMALLCWTIAHHFCSVSWNHAIIVHWVDHIYASLKELYFSCINMFEIGSRKSIEIKRFVHRKKILL